MLLVEADINSTLHRISNERLALEHYWDKKIISFEPVKKLLDYPYGGFGRIGAGGISLAPDVFKGAGDWPPPDTWGMTAKQTASTEAAAETLYSATAHLDLVKADEVSYDLHGASYDTMLLSETTDYNGDTVPLPRAFGEIVHKRPVRLPDVGGNPTYHKAYISGTLAKAITGVSDNGSGQPRFTVPGHGFNTSDSATIEVGSFNHTYNGTHTITKIDTNNFDVTGLGYVDNQTGHAAKTGYWRVYDDGVPIAGNVTDNGDGTFSLSSSPVGEVTLSGTGEDTTLTDIVDWACSETIDAGRDGLDLTYNSANARSPSPAVSFWADTQEVLVDFLSNLTAFFTHYFDIKSDTLYLGDMKIDNGSRTIDEFEFFPSEYNLPAPVKLIRCKWVMRERVEETVGKYIKDTDHKTCRMSSYPYGNEMNLVPYHNDQSNIEDALNDILNILHARAMTLKIPIESDPPEIGEKISLTDTAQAVDTHMWLRVRSITYEYDAEDIDTAIIEGEGAMAAA